MGKLRICVVGLGFGAEFVPIYLDHPDVASVDICDLNTERLAKTAGRFAIRHRFTQFEDVLRADDIDAVHLLSGIPDHARQTIALLESGKHCACALPMATNRADLEAVLAASRASGRNYMLMETAVYTRPYFLAQAMRDRGEFGRLQFLRGALFQDLEGWPSYWAGFPPMWYSTHALAPLLALSGSRAVNVRCVGSGVMREELRAQYGNPFPIESAMFELDAPALFAEVTVSFFGCARPYMESFVAYGENACYEWQMEKDPPVLFRMGPLVPGQKRVRTTERPDPPDRADWLPASIGRYTRSFMYGADEHGVAFEQGGGHHGSHPHLVHEFVRSIVERRQPRIDAVTAANWTIAGLCAHESALAGGREVVIPDYRNLP